MGNFRHRFEVLDPSGRRSEPVDAVVDTGSAYTWVPRSVLERFGYKPAFQRTFKLADGTTTERDVVEALVRIGDQTLHRPPRGKASSDQPGAGLRVFWRDPPAGRAIIRPRWRVLTRS
jgi:hypothetical protein